MSKKKTSIEKCGAKFLRTIKKTGKWRGKKSEEYVKYKKVKRKFEFLNADSEINDKLERKIYLDYLKKTNGKLYETKTRGMAKNNRSKSRESSGYRGKPTLNKQTSKKLGS